MGLFFNFRNVFLSGLAVLCATGAQAAPVLAPGSEVETVYRYEFDVVGSDISYPTSVVRNDAGDEIDDPALADALTENIHPLKEMIGQTGRTVIELTRIRSIDDTLDGLVYLECKSGSLCDYETYSTRYTDYFFSSYRHASFGSTGFNLNDADISWTLTQDGAGNGTLFYDWDDYNSGDNFYSVAGERYAPTSDGLALFTLANVQVLQLDGGTSDQAPLVSTPLPASALLLLAGLGGASLALRRRRK